MMPPRNIINLFGAGNDRGLIVGLHYSDLLTFFKRNKLTLEDEKRLK